MSSARVSVIIPTYNRADLLRLTIDSVLAQTYPDIEVIVVNDGSTDGTAALLESYGSRINAISKQNEGGTAARNTGIAAATGDYLTFLDHDDLLLPDKIQQQMDLFARQPDLRVVCTRWHYIDHEGRRIDTIGPIPDGDVFRTLVLGCFLWSGAPLIHRHALETVGPFDPAIWSSDWDMWLRLAGAGFHFGCVQIPLGSYRILSDSTMSAVHRTEQMDSRLFDKVFARPDLPPEIPPLRDQALAIWHFWLSRRYAATGAYEDAARNFQHSIRLYPPIAQDITALADTLVNEALDVRVSDGVQFMRQFLQLLPPEVPPLSGQVLLSRVHLGLALRAFSRGQAQVGRDALHQLEHHDRSRLPSDEQVISELVASGVRHAEDVDSYLRTVFEHLPPALQHLKSHQRHVQADIEAAHAFDQFAAGAYEDARRSAARAFIQRPGWLKNRGFASVFVKSLIRR